MFNAFANVHIIPQRSEALADRHTIQVAAYLFV